MSGTVYALVLVLAAAPRARADAQNDAAAISKRLRDWAADFNARNAAGVCGLFAPDLIATVRGAADRGREELCRHLAQVLADQSRRLSYTPDIREIVVSGDLAFVRLVWTLEVEQRGVRHTSQEPGLDIFRRQPNGEWSISRFLAYSTDPD